MQIKHIYSGFSNPAIAKILKNKIHFFSNEALFEFGDSAIERLYKKAEFSSIFWVFFWHETRSHVLISIVVTQCALEYGKSLKTWLLVLCL